MTRYAADTSVSVSASKAEIERRDGARELAEAYEIDHWDAVG